SAIVLYDDIGDMAHGSKPLVRACAWGAIAELKLLIWRLHRPLAMARNRRAAECDKQNRPGESFTDAFIDGETHASTVLPPGRRRRVVSDLASHYIFQCGDAAR